MHFTKKHAKKGQTSGSKKQKDLGMYGIKLFRADLSNSGHSNSKFTLKGKFGFWFFAKLTKNCQKLQIFHLSISVDRDGIKA